MRAITREELKASRPEGAPSLTRTSGGTPDACPWVLSPDRERANSAQRRSARFVAGATFFNYSDYGSLRPGQQPIELFSKPYVGFAIHAFVCGFAFNFFSFGYGRLLAEYLRANDEQQVKAANYVLVWPSTLSLLIGLISDSFPICGYQRKGYMVLGWMLTLSMCITLIILELYSDSGRLLLHLAADDDNRHASPFVAAYLLVSLLAAVGIQISWVSAIAASIEYAQREHLHHRGRHHGALLTLFNSGGACAMLLTWCVISDGHSEDHLVSTLSMGGAARILASVSVASVPIILFGYQEARVDTIVEPVRVAERLHTFWRFLHRNVVYRVLLFVIFHLFFLGICDQNVRDAVQRWSGVSRKDALAVEVGRNSAMMLGTLLWTIFLRNVHWRKLCVWGSLLYITAFIVLTTFTTFNVVRNEWFFGAMFMVIDVPRGLLLLFVFHFSGEISDFGHEGVTVGLALSYQRLVALAGFMISAIFPKVVGFEVSTQEMLLDSATARANVTKAFFIGVAFNLLCFPVIKLLPHQKLDAQQLRAFGGYNKYAGAALLVTLVVLVSFNLVVNLLTIL
jgi:hypothetical protein